MTAEHTEHNRLIRMWSSGVAEIFGDDMLVLSLRDEILPAGGCIIDLHGSIECIVWYVGANKSRHCLSRQRDRSDEKQLIVIYSGAMRLRLFLIPMLFKGWQSRLVQYNCSNETLKFEIFSSSFSIHIIVKSGMFYFSLKVTKMNRLFLRRVESPVI